MKNVAIVAAHFVPSNLAAVHRARLWSLHLREFGWNPIIVTTHWDYYEESPEFELEQLLPPDLRIIRTRAFVTKPVRLIGDIGIRAFWWHFQALSQLARQGEMDFLHITIPSNFSACLGRLVHRNWGTPYGIDYIDPWVNDFPGSDQPFTKAWGSAKLAKLLEPWAVKNAALITGINPLYFEDVLKRNPTLRQSATLAAMPYGGSDKDHELVRAHPRPAYLFAAHTGKRNIVYAGAMLPQAYVVLERLFEALRLMKDRDTNLAQKVCLHFIGTGKTPNDPQGFNVKPLAERYGVANCVSEHPHRILYADVLNHLQLAHGILVLGSTEPHYSPSKIFQSVMAQRPVLALLHEKSSAVEILRQSAAGHVITLTENELPPKESVAAEMDEFINRNDYSPAQVEWKVFETYSARESARKLAAALDLAILKKA